MCGENLQTVCIIILLSSSKKEKDYFDKSLRTIKEEMCKIKVVFTTLPFIKIE